MSELDGRWDPVPELDKAQKESKLEAIKRAFGSEWLRRDDGNPLQKLWLREDALSTAELLLLGDAISFFEESHSAFLKEQVKQIKSKAGNNRAGAFFELIGLNLFNGDGQDVQPAKRKNPGFDGTVTTKDSDPLRISIKSHSKSEAEKYFTKQSEEIERLFVEELRAFPFNGLGLRVLAKEHPDSESKWSELRSALREAIEGAILRGDRTKLLTNWAIIIKPLGEEFHPLSSGFLSYTVQILSPHQHNEEKRLVDNIANACSNLERHAPSNDDAQKAILLRLPTTANIDACAEAAREYFNQTPGSPIDVVYLYHPVVVTEALTSSNFISHYIKAVLKPGARLPRLQLSSLIGVILTEPTRPVARSELGELDLSHMYSYQSGHIYKRVTSKEYGRIDSPAPGVFLYATYTADGREEVVGGKYPPTHDLVLFP